MFDELTRKNEEILAQAISISYEQLKEAHIQDYQNLFKRVDLSLANRKARRDS